MRLFAHLVATVLAVAAGLAWYDRQVFRPSQRYGLVDVNEVYRIKEREWTELLTKGQGDADRAKALALAEQFSKVFPRALQELSRDCRCVVFVRSALASDGPDTVDMTDLLKRKVGILP